jgi:hypothetical protein
VTIPLDGSEGFFTRLGKIGLTHNTILEHLRAGAGAMGPLVDDIAAEYATTDQDVIAGTDGLYAALATYRSSPSSWFSYSQGLAQRTITAMADDDSPLNVEAYLAALEILIYQMLVASESVNLPTMTLGSPAYGSLNEGDGTLVGTIKAGDGSTQPYIFDETVRLVCTSDVTDGATKWNETFSVTTPASVGNLEYTWPEGSGVSSTLQSVNPSADAGQGNLLTNSDFNTFTVANTPDSWTISVGEAGTDILAGGSGEVYAGANCLRLTYNASGPLSELRQAVTVTAATAYTFSCLMKKTAGLSGAGAIRLALVDGSGTVLTDPQGNACSASFTLSGFTTSYVRKNLTTWTPRILPTTTYLQIKITTAIADASQSVYIDWGALNAMSQLYTGGPMLSLFSGASQWLKDDVVTVAVNNAYDGLLLLYADRVFDLRTNGLVLPTDASPSVADSLIT